ncbi:caspase (peptidase) [Bradyrhizobium sp. WBOS7]|uniref:Caspase (Peptidase) n=1 Tax=Bradyrhizobium betae TaxID=244734 RepID=A0AAE9N9T5_9BRAD|nr:MULTISPECIES: caspase family protein [Bradyrhizobium]MDD1570737.1 caspase (peptidase) [Bradyrhizobium sp. WBOS1]UUO34818.1 caspase (peptidase) [Bradyrhizobium sp. WBOS01]MDD1527583.1 caspase (peptidase) [Bradyrhizobium sp. WBOS2]MDD1578495.1 caspase (peptidase) [Bradyrhizobium sp. WBOS7]MDD1601218.1 caspase (peptidase) [Bradyrhizobium sp. WBOS16]
MRRLGLIAMALAFCLAGESARAEKRVALVFGNSGYQNVTALTNPANDAAAMAEMFRKASFDVIDSRRDLKYMEMRRALRDFTEKARGADIAVIYFAGHGLEVDGTNYAVPVDAVLERDSDVDDEAVSLNRILLAVEPAAKLRLVILDACRDNPFAKKMKRTIASRSLGRGLIGVEANRPNTFIAFAAKEGATASDGDGRNSPFTTALVKHLTIPGLDIRKAFGFVRDDVMSATASQQEPYTTNSLGGNDVSLVPAPAVPALPARPADTDVRADYELAERVGTVEGWDSFIAAHPSGFYANLAKAQRNKLTAETERAAAAEKARQAADERARLAVEGAKAADQAKAEAEVKATEQARIAAEKKKQVEEAKLAAEQNRLAEQAKAAEIKKAAELQREAEAEAKKASAAKLAATNEAPQQPDTPTPGSAQPTGRIAMVTPTPEPQASRAIPSDLPRLLQAELKRVGCKTGEVGNEWNDQARRALSLFNQKAGTKLDTRLASLDALDAVQAKAGRVCPLECDRGFRASGEVCVKITCEAGYVLSAGGSCVKRPEATRERRSPSSASRGKCFVYQGTSFCE